MGLRKKDYCILNKQYSKEEYEKLRGQIISDMKNRGEYGDFFPASLSAFGYNESAAQDQFPLEKEAALALGFQWEDTSRGIYGKENVKWEEVGLDEEGYRMRDVSQSIFACVECKKNFRVIPREQAFYVKLVIPLPRLCPDCRHLRRFITRGPNRLYFRSCSCEKPSHFHGTTKCSNVFETPHINHTNLYCEQCYQSEVS